MGVTYATPQRTREPESTECGYFDYQREKVYFRTNDAASLAENIRRLNEDRIMRRAFAELAYNRARERFTTKRMIEEYLQLYRSLVRLGAAAA